MDSIEEYYREKELQQVKKQSYEKHKAKVLDEFDFYTYSKLKIWEEGDKKGYQGMYDEIFKWNIKKVKVWDKLNDVLFTKRKEFNSLEKEKELLQEEEQAIEELGMIIYESSKVENSLQSNKLGMTGSKMLIPDEYLIKYESEIMEVKDDLLRENKTSSSNLKKINNLMEDIKKRKKRYLMLNSEYNHLNTLKQSTEGLQGQSSLGEKKLKNIVNIMKLKFSDANTDKQLNFDLLSKLHEKIKSKNRENIVVICYNREIINKLNNQLNLLMQKIESLDQEIAENYKKKKIFESTIYGRQIVLSSYLSLINSQTIEELKVENTEEPVKRVRLLRSMSKRWVLKNYTDQIRSIDLDLEFANRNMELNDCTNHLIECHKSFTKQIKDKDELFEKYRNQAYQKRQLYNQLEADIQGYRKSMAIVGKNYNPMNLLDTSGLIEDKLFNLIPHDRTGKTVNILSNNYESAKHFENIWSILFKLDTSIFNIIRRFEVIFLKIISMGIQITKNIEVLTSKFSYFNMSLNSQFLEVWDVYSKKIDRLNTNLEINSAPNPANMNEITNTDSLQSTSKPINSNQILQHKITIFDHQNSMYYENNDKSDKNLKSAQNPFTLFSLYSHDSIWAKKNMETNIRNRIYKAFESTLSEADFNILMVWLENNAFIKTALSFEDMEEIGGLMDLYEVDRSDVEAILSMFKEQANERVLQRLRELLDHYSIVHKVWEAHIEKYYYQEELERDSRTLWTKVQIKGTWESKQYATIPKIRHHERQVTTEETFLDTHQSTSMTGDDSQDFEEEWEKDPFRKMIFDIKNQSKTDYCSGNQFMKQIMQLNKGISAIKVANVHLNKVKSKQILDSVQKIESALKTDDKKLFRHLNKVKRYKLPRIASQEKKSNTLSINIHAEGSLERPRQLLHPKSSKNVQPQKTIEFAIPLNSVSGPNTHVRSQNLYKLSQNQLSTRDTYTARESRVNFQNNLAMSSGKKKIWSSSNSSKQIPRLANLGFEAEGGSGIARTSGMFSSRDWEGNRSEKNLHSKNLTSQRMQHANHCHDFHSINIVGNIVSTKHKRSLTYKGSKGSKVYRIWEPIETSKNKSKSPTDIRGVTDRVVPLSIKLKQHYIV